MPRPSAASNRSGEVSDPNTTQQGEDTGAAGAQQGNGAASAPAEKPAAAPKPAWQADDYTGPLTADQAAWRHRHIKPVTASRKK